MLAYIPYMDPMGNGITFNDGTGFHPIKSIKIP